jgi:hypothetical protein
MSQKAKFIIIILGALILFGVLIITIFDIFPRTDQEPSDITQEFEIGLPDKNADLPENTVFDSSNAQEFALLSPGAASQSTEGALEQEAKGLARFFVERFGTYSTDAGFAYINDILGFTTPEYKATLEAFKENQLERSGFYSITADIIAIETTLFSLPGRRAEFAITTQRAEQSGTSAETFSQEVLVSLEQNSSGQWRVNTVLWGAREK